ncbi:MAG: NUDIX hydrolase [Magnetococcales bacterium]|nr:NUDIX hydrolase [Magnetococcales bacterium]MBF0155806.1 NUDIX hydrolase [Magnetococcales bacterium]
MGTSLDDPRLHRPACEGLVPVRPVVSTPWFEVNDRGGHFSVECRQLQVAVLPIVAGESVVLARVRRPLLSEATWELPGGGAMEGETTRETARRELAEETGIRIPELERFRPLMPLCFMPRYPVLPHLFEVAVTEAEFRERGEHDGEVEGILRLSWQEVTASIFSGELFISLSVAVLARHLLARNPEAR